MQLFNAPQQRNYSPIFIPEDVAVYRVKDGKFWCDDTLYEVGQIVAYEDEPSLEMEPLNQKAVDAMRTLYEKLNKLGQEAADKAGTKYIGYTQMQETAYELAKLDGKKAIALNQAAPDILGGKRKGGRKKAQVIEPEAANGVGIERLGKLRDSEDSFHKANEGFGVS